MTRRKQDLPENECDKLAIIFTFEREFKRNNDMRKREKNSNKIK